MAILTKKFSEFADGGDLEPNQETAGLESSTNVLFTNPFPLLSPGTTAERPAIAASMYYRLRFNTTTESYEYYSPTAVAWVQLTDTNLLTILASNTAGEGASLIGLQNQSNVTSKTVQDLANASFIAQVSNGSLQNAQYTSLLSTGFVSVTTATGVLASRTIGGTANQINVTNSDGAGNSVHSLSSTLNFPGTFTVQSTTAISAIINDNTMATAAATNIPTSSSIKAYVDASIGSAVTSVSGTVNRITSTGGTTPVIDISASYVGQASITTLGTLTSGTWNATLIGTIYGGTGLASYNQGDLIYASAANTLAALAKNTTATRYLSNTGASNNPAWAQVDLSNGIAGFGTGVATALGQNVTGSGGIVLQTSPTITTPVIGQINDANGNEMLSFSAIGSAVNYFNIANSITGANPIITAFGDDANVGFIWQTKGTGQLNLNSANLTQPLIINSGTTLQHATRFNMANTAAIRDVTWPDANGTVLMTGTAINSVPSITFSSTSGIIGTTTNDNAAAGSVGEIIESTVLVGSAVSATSTANLDVTSISLTAGVWYVWGIIALYHNAATTTTAEFGWINTTSATQATLPNGGASAYHRVSLAAGLNMFFPVGQRRISVSGTTTVYLSANITFAVNTMSVYGYIGARRRR